MFRTYMILLLLLGLVQCATPRRSYGKIGYAGLVESEPETTGVTITAEQCLDWSTAYHYGPPPLPDLIRELDMAAEKVVNAQIYASYQCLRVESSR